MVDFGDPIGREQGYRRPAVIISSDRMNRSAAGLVVVVPTTRTKRGIASHVEIEAGASGLSDTSYAKVEDIKSISTERLIRHRGHAPLEAMSRISSIARLILEL